MAERRAFLLRIDPELYDALSRWAEDDLRSLNGQIEYLLRDASAARGRAVRRGRDESGDGPTKGKSR